MVLTTLAALFASVAAAQDSASVAPAATPSTAAAVGTAAPVPAAAPDAPAAKKPFRVDRAALADHLRETYNIPAAVDVAFSTPVESGVPSFLKMEVTFSKGENSQQDVLYISEDGRHYMLGGFKDLKSNPDQERLAKVDLRGSPVRGPKGAPVTIIQYTDFECPFCQRGFELMRDKVLKDYPGKVRWVYKSLPLTSIHPWAEPAAVAAECVKDQGLERFWKVHDALFERQREITPDNFDEKAEFLAKEAGADTKAFAACYEAKRTLGTVNRDAKEADGMGISGTPAFLVNGHLVPGADYQTIKRLIDESLKGRHGKG